MRSLRRHLLSLTMLLLAAGGSVAQPEHPAHARHPHAAQPRPVKAERPVRPPPLPVAQPEPEPAAKSRVEFLSIETGMGQVLTLKTAASNLFVADPKVLEVRPASATNLFVFGVGPGRTTVAAMDADGHTVAEYLVTVTPSLYNAAEAQSAIARLMPGIHIAARGQTSGIVLSGRVDTPEQAAQAVSIARSFLGEKQTVENLITIQSSAQVTLRVRIVEMARSVTRNLGISLAAVGTVGNIGAFPALGASVNGLTSSCGSGSAYTATCKGIGFSSTITALAEDNLIRTLAEPNLTVLSGQAASFLVGGEYPIPVGQSGGSTTVELKKYGITLSFQPTVLNDGRISIHVAPEVSELSQAGAVTMTSGNSTIAIPALTVRRAETTVELGSGQSFAMAGLLQDSINQGFTNLPYMADLPILGTLFRSNSFQRQQTELVILVTPIIVKPVDDEAMLHLPTDGFKEPSDFEQVFEGRQKAGPKGSPPVRISIPGDAGVIVQ